MRRLTFTRAFGLRVGDVVKLELVSVLVVKLYRSRDRVSVVTEQGYPVDFDSWELLTVLR